LPGALINGSGLWLIPAAEGEEVMDLAAMTQRFEIEHIPIGCPIFDVPKLDWLNGKYIREQYDV